MPRVRSWPALAFAAAALVAALAPVWPARGTAANPGADAFPGWPATIDGQRLTELALSEREQRFARGFPGRIARFSDGRREIVLRWVARPTRMLHPAADCFRGLGYRVTPAPMRQSLDGQPMSCFTAAGAGGMLRVCEQIRSDPGASWPDVSSWYWHALWAGHGSWWSLVIAEPGEG